MNAKYLRIGNLVYADLYGETSILVESICSKNNDVFNSTTGEIPFTSLKPIILTEQWLLKLGFVPVICFDNPRTIKCLKENFSVVSKDNHFEFRYYDCILKNINYVHELQNLYFALTGEELVYSNAVS